MLQQMTYPKKTLLIVTMIKGNAITKNEVLKPQKWSSKDESTDLENENKTIKLTNIRVCVHTNQDSTT